MAHPAHRTPFAARLHAIPRAFRGVHRVLIRTFRRYFSRAPGWVLLTTTGRTTGLPREVLLPCERTPDTLIVISTYGWQSDWIRNIRDDPRVRMTSAGWVVEGEGTIIEEVEAKRALVTAHPYFAPVGIGWLQDVTRVVCRPLLVVFLRWWVTQRPVVVIRRATPHARTEPED